MERDAIPVEPGWEYDHYFPRAKGGRKKIKEGATVEDTLKLIPKVVAISIPQGQRFAKAVIKGTTVEDTCRRLWTFTYKKIAYKRDRPFTEEVRDVARVWKDRHNIDPDTGEKSGCDCDCLTVWCSAHLCALGLGKHLFFRVTKYRDPDDPGKPASEISWSHIYPILKLPNGKQITIDCVVHQFNYEEPYLDKKDIAMNLEYLNGVPDNSRSANPDTQDLMGMMDEQQALAELGRILKRKGGNSAAKTRRREKFKKIAGKGLHLTNRLNPAIGLLRGGVLAAMKINFMKIGSSLRYTYLSDEQAQSKGILMDRFHKLKRVREKLEKIFYGAGGKPENLKKAILKGRGNRDKAVPLAGLGYAYENVDGLHEDMSLRQLLGPEIYHSEYVDGLEGVNGLGQLGEPATAASIAAATTVLTTIAALIKSVGSIFPKKADAAGKGKKGKDDEAAGDENTPPDTHNSNSGSDNSSSTPPPAAEQQDGNIRTADPANSSESNTSAGSGDPGKTPGDENTSGNDDNETTNGSADKTNPPATPSVDGEDNTNTNKPALRNGNKTPPASTDKAATFWENNKKWIKPVGIGVGSLSLIALFYQLFKPKPKAQQAKAEPVFNGLTRKPKQKPKGDFLNGIKPKKKKGGHAQSKKKTTNKKQVITLL